MSSTPARPQARQDGLIVEEIGDELVVFDQTTDEAHCVDRVASVVWRCCDGEYTVRGIAGVVQQTFEDVQGVLDVLDARAGCWSLRRRVGSPDAG